MEIAVGDTEANFARLHRMMTEAASADPKPDVLVFPEMWNTGYALDRIGELADSNGERTKEVIGSFCREHSIHAVAGSIAEKREDGVYNTTYVFDREGRVTAQYSKVHLFRLMDEEKHLLAGDRLVRADIDGIPAGLQICYDIRFPELSRTYALGGAKLLFVPAEWPHPRLAHWRTLLLARAIENQTVVIACNRVGTSGTTSFFGHSMIIGPWGDILLEGGEEEAILTADVPVAEVEAVRRKIPVFEDRKPGLYRLD